MFSDTLVESGAHHRRSGWSTLFSIMLQSGMVALLALIPLLKHDVFVLPSTTPLVPLLAPTAPPPTQIVEHNNNATPAGPILNLHPSSTSISSTASPIAPGPAPTIPFGLGTDTHSLLKGIPMSYSNPGPPPPDVHAKPAAPPVKPSVLMEGNLIHKVQPVYPAIARQIHLQGTVQLRAVIAADGAVHDIDVISGPPLLVQAARDAVRQWRYRPYVLNGHAIEVESQVTVRFVLGD
jgi:protein TonB